MMLKEKSSPWARLKYLYVLPVAAIAMTAFARPEVSDKVEEISRVSDVLEKEQVSSLLSQFQDVSADKVNDLAANAETKVAETAEKVLEAPMVKALPADTTKPVEVKYIPTEVREKLKGTPAFEVVENMPEFPGGIPAIMDYLQKNLRYPEAAKKAGTQGRVTVQFVVDKDGSIKDPKVVRPIDKDMDAEAVRLIASMPKWKPGMQKGQAVAVKYTLPVKFSLNEENEFTVVGVPRADVDNSELGTADVTIYVDNVKVDTKGKKLKDILPADRIESIKVRKDKDGKGELYITTKSVGK